MKSLKAQLESKRNLMINIINDYGISSREALVVSQELDILIIKYQKSIAKCP